MARRSIARADLSPAPPAAGAPRRALCRGERRDRANGIPFPERLRPEDDRFSLPLDQIGTALLHAVFLRLTHHLIHRIEGPLQAAIGQHTRHARDGEN